MPTNETTVAVVGCGQMGRGIAQVAASHGCKVLLADVSLASAQAAKETLAAVCVRLVEKNKMTLEQSTALVERLQPVSSLDACAEASLVVEAASEVLQAKQALFKKLDSVVSANTVLASNTSSISITQLAAVTQHPERVIGMHFMNPVPVMALVEIIQGTRTSETTYQRTVQWAQAWGKQVVTSSDYPGFIVNRILMPMINEAVYALMEHVASAKDIDNAMVLGTHQPMGPLALADLIGLDTCLSILQVMHRDLGDPKYRPCPLLARMVNAGLLGRKSGEGFYTYNASGKPS
jgi:3-hydroxybutyryl-CoA dehydrogenase